MAKASKPKTPKPKTPAPGDQPVSTGQAWEDGGEIGSSDGESIDCEPSEE